MAPFKIAAVTLMCGVLSTCVTFDPRACPTEKVYTRSEQQQLAAEYKKLPPATKQAIVDYLDLRDKARACRGRSV
jgi:hypothetical protein